VPVVVRPSSLSVASFALATSLTVTVAAVAGVAMARLAAPAAPAALAARGAAAAATGDRARVATAAGAPVRESRRGGDVDASLGADDGPTRVDDPTATRAGADGGDRDALRRRRLSDGAVGTYVGEILLERDSALSRWPTHVAEPLTVWVQPWAAVTGWDDRFAARARDAFGDWERTGIPVRFAFVDDSAAADLHVTWIDHFDEPISGKTLWTRDERWWITGASITLALHHQDGEPLDAGAVRAIALHEVGHLLGLDHTSDPGNVMTPRVRVRDLSAADRATVRLLYSLPPGRVR